MMWLCGVTAFFYNKLKSAYVKCCKIFFGYSKYYSVTAMLHELDFSDFNTVIDRQSSACLTSADFAV